MASIINANTSGGLISTGDTSGQLQLQTGGTTALTVTSAQNVGIGTTSPAYKLDVLGTINTSVGATTTNALSINATTAGYGSVVTYQTGGVTKYTAGLNVVTGTGEWGIYDNSAATTRFYLNSSGNLGLGTTNPDAKLKIVVSPASGALTITDNTSSDFLVTPAVSSGVCRVGPSAGAMAFYANNIEAMRIDSSGRVGIGVVPSATGCGLFVQYSGTYTFGLNSGTFTWYQGTSGNNFNFYSGEGTLRGYLTLAGSFTNTSDVSLKENIVDLTYGLPEILQLKPRNYNVKGYEPKQIGFIAQEVQSILPELVDENNGLLGLSYGNMTAVLTKAIQELSTQLTELKAEVATLRGA
jgi:hypothetical protein